MYSLGSFWSYSNHDLKDSQKRHGNAKIWVKMQYITPFCNYHTGHVNSTVTNYLLLRMNIWFPSSIQKADTINWCFCDYCKLFNVTCSSWYQPVISLYLWKRTVLKLILNYPLAWFWSCISFVMLQFVAWKFADQVSGWLEWKRQRFSVIKWMLLFLFQKSPTALAAPNGFSSQECTMFEKGKYICQSTDGQDAKLSFVEHA